LKTSIIQVETSDVDVTGDDDNDDHDGGPGGDDDDEGGPGPPRRVAAPRPGEYDEAMDVEKMETDDSRPHDADQLENTESKKKSKKTKISFEEYNGIANAIATHLRSLEESSEHVSSEGTDDHGHGGAGSSSTARYLQWSQIVEWYLEQCEQDIGDSLERLDEMRKKINLVIRRLLRVDSILVTVGGDAPASKKDEPKTLLAVHPNYVL
jgi:MCM6 C-terminal winged-helix domain